MINREWSYLMTAVMFYTCIPTPRNTSHSNDALNKSRKYFPAIGIMIGLIGSASFWLANLALNLPISIAVSMVATLLATGAFHEDGFADSCDGLGGGWAKEQVLSIMKDSRLGTYGAVGLYGMLSIKFLALNELAAEPFICFALVYIGAHTSSRFIASIVIELYDYVQDINASKVKPVTGQRLNHSSLLTSIIITTIPLVLLAQYNLTSMVYAFIIASITGLGFAHYSKVRVGGYTGDILGAVQQLAEVCFYLTLLAFL